MLCSQPPFTTCTRAPCTKHVATTGEVTVFLTSLSFSLLTHLGFQCFRLVMLCSQPALTTCTRTPGTKHVATTPSIACAAMLVILLTHLGFQCFRHLALLLALPLARVATSVAEQITAAWQLTGSFRTLLSLSLTDLGFQRILVFTLCVNDSTVVFVFVVACVVCMAAATVSTRHMPMALQFVVQCIPRRWREAMVNMGRVNRRTTKAIVTAAWVWHRCLAHVVIEGVPLMVMVPVPVVMSMITAVVVAVVVPGVVVVSLAQSIRHGHATTTTPTTMDIRWEHPEATATATTATAFDSMMPAAATMVTRNLCTLCGSLSTLLLPYRVALRHLLSRRRLMRYLRLVRLVRPHSLCSMAVVPASWCPGCRRQPKLSAASFLLPQPQTAITLTLT